LVLIKIMTINVCANLLLSVAVLLFFFRPRLEGRQEGRHIYIYIYIYIYYILYIYIICIYNITYISYTYVILHILYIYI